MYDFFLDFRPSVTAVVSTAAFVSLDRMRTSRNALTARKHDSRPMESRASIMIISLSYLGYKLCQQTPNMQRRCAIEQTMYMSLGLSRMYSMAPIIYLYSPPLFPAVRTIPFFYFSDERDIALGLSTDGFAPFKRRDKTCWPIILFNYNLPPEIRFQKKYCIHIATVPGPKKPWDWDSFCWPLVQELIQLELGVKTFDAISQTFFLLHAYLILVFGDIPAVALVMRMKGQNGIKPCRICNIKGVRFQSRTNYVPLRRDKIPGARPPRYLSSDLPIRSHEEMMNQARDIEMAPNKATYERLAKEYGIKGIPVLGSLSSISFPSSFPFDFMHLIWENLIPNLIEFWTGNFKDLDHEDEDYYIEPRIWDEIGAATAACKATIPAVFGAPVPNIATNQSPMSAEMYANWTLFIAPIVLRGRFKSARYYRHFMRLVEVLKLCLAFEITEEMVDQIDKGFQLWVEDYEM